MDLSTTDKTTRHQQVYPTALFLPVLLCPWVSDAHQIIIITIITQKKALVTNFYSLASLLLLFCFWLDLGSIFTSLPTRNTASWHIAFLRSKNCHAADIFFFPLAGIKKKKGSSMSVSDSFIDPQRNTCGEGSL